MNIFKTKTPSFLLGRSLLHLVECAHGSQLAAFTYLIVCSGGGAIPLRVTEYLYMICGVSTFFLATSVARDGLWNRRSLVPLLILLSILLLLILVFATATPTRDYFSWVAAVINWVVWVLIWAALVLINPIAPLLVHLVRRPRSAVIISASFFVALVVGASCVRIFTTEKLQKVIAKTLAEGGCVFSTGAYDGEMPRAISSIDEVNIGVVVSAGSDRVYFIHDSAAKSWSYSLVQAVENHYVDQRMRFDCYSRRSGISAVP